MFKVFESGSGKWLRLNDDVGDILFVSDEAKATIFSDNDLISADQCFWEFSIYKRTIHAVPVGTNKYPTECDTVKVTIAAIKDK